MKTVHHALQALARSFAHRVLRELVAHGAAGDIALFLRDHAPPVLPGLRMRKAGTRNKAHLGPRSRSYQGIPGNRSYDAIETDVDRIVRFLVEAGGPVRGKEIRDALGLTKDRFLRTVHRGIVARRIWPLGHMAKLGYVAAEREARYSSNRF